MVFVKCKENIFGNYLVSKQKVSWYLDFEIYKKGLFFKHLLIYFIFHFKISEMTESKTEIEKHELQPVHIVVVHSLVQSDQTDSYDFFVQNRKNLYIKKK